MYRKITLRALGRKWGFRGASGLADGPAAVAAFARAAKNPSRSSRPARARPVKPAPASQRNSRRVRWQKVPSGRGKSEARSAMAGPPSIQVHHLVQVQHHQAEVFEGPLARHPVLPLEGLDQVHAALDFLL